ncbi:unnamed protein product, partial [Citrullus colocynthis]
MGIMKIRALDSCLNLNSLNSYVSCLCSPLFLSLQFSSYQSQSVVIQECSLQLPATSETAISLHFLTKRWVAATTNSHCAMTDGTLQAMVKVVNLG